MKSWHSISSRRKSQAFTLIELLIVLAIIIVLFAILAVAAMHFLGQADEKKTEAHLATLGDSGMAKLGSNDFNKLLKLTTLRVYTSDDFKKATNINNAKDYNNLNPMQRSKLLAFLLAPTQEQWNKIVTSKNLAWRPQIKEDDAKGFIQTDPNDGFNYVADGWGNPISFEIWPGLGASTEIKWALISGGPDGDMQQSEDNMNYSPDKKHYEGPAK